MKLLSLWDKVSKITLHLVVACSINCSVVLCNWILFRIRVYDARCRVCILFFVLTLLVVYVLFTLDWTMLFVF